MKRKKIATILFSLLFMVITVSSCVSGEYGGNRHYHKSNEVLSVESMIENLGGLLFVDEAPILEVEEAYNSLSERDRERVKNHSILLATRVRFNAWKEESNRTHAQHKEKADEVILLINQIGDVTLDSDNVIIKARNAYEGLNATQKDMVTNYFKLTASEEIFHELQQLDKIYNVVLLIENIGLVTTDSRRTIENAFHAFNNLDEDLKAQVINHNILISKINEFITLIVSHIEELINEIGTVSLSSGESISAAANEYNLLHPNDKKEVSNASVLYDSQEIYNALVAEEELRLTTLAAEEELRIATEEARSIIRVRRLWHSRPNFVGGVDVYIHFTNNSEKTIKYIDFSIQFRNNVGDIVRCDIRNSSHLDYRATGPFESGKGINGTTPEWESFYNHTVRSVELRSLRIEYMDGTTKTLSTRQLELVQG